MNYKLLSIVFFSVLLLTVVSARVEIVRPNVGASITTITGNLTNISQMVDVYTPAPGAGEVLTWNNTLGTWASQAAGSSNNASMNNYVLDLNTSNNNYIAENNASVENYILYVNSTNGGTNIDATWRANWTAYNTTWSTDTDTWVANFTLYYTSAEVDAINNSINNYILVVNNSNNNYIADNNDSVNNNIDDKLTTTFYDAAVLDPVTGTPVGTIGNITIYDSLSYNVTEDASEMELIVNFTGVTELNQIIVRYKSSSDESHTMVIQLRNYADDVWEDYRTIANTENNFDLFTMTVFDSSDHIEDGVVQLRFYTNGGAPPKTHLHQFDWVSVSSGPATPASDETDPFAIHRDGVVPFEANWDQGAFNLTNIASWFFGIIFWDQIPELNTTIDSLILANNASIENYILYVNSTNDGTNIDATWVANWTAYNSTWSSMINESYRLNSNETFYELLNFSSGFVAYDPSGNQAMEIDGRVLYDTSEDDSLNWEDRALYSSGVVDSLDWENRLLTADSGSDIILDWATADIAEFKDNNLTTTGNVTADYFIGNDLNVSGNFTIGEGTIWWNGTMMIFN